jgi:hypothetical protein
MNNALRTRQRMFALALPLTAAPYIGAVPLAVELDFVSAVPQEAEMAQAVGGFDDRRLGRAWLPAEFLLGAVVADTLASASAPVSARSRASQSVAFARR